MTKIIKLILLAAVVIGGIVGVVSIIDNSDRSIDGPKVSSPVANDWKMKIDELCKEGKWTQSGYTNIETGIRTDRVASNGELITLDEENALQKYLYTSSCAYLNNQVDKLFKQSSYPDNTVKASEGMLSFLNTKVGDYGANSNLTEASNLLSEYHQLLSALSSTGVHAVYSHPLRAYSGSSAEANQRKARGLKHYNSHFSKNPSIKSKVDNLTANNAGAESAYYAELEKCVENHYRATKDLGVLLDDQIRFEQISTNSSAKAALRSFVNNPNR